MNFQLTLFTRLLLLVAVGFAPIFAPQRATPVQAAQQYAYYWSLTFDYENNFNGLFHVAVGFAENGGVQNPPLSESTFPVACQRVGNVGLAGGSAVFNGGYLACNVDMQRMLRAAIATCNQVSPGCDFAVEDVEKYQSFRLIATVTSTTTNAAPIFYHEDANYMIAPGMSAAQITANLTPLGLVSSAALPAALGAANSYESRYQCGVGGCVMKFAVNGTTEYLPQGNASVEFSTPPATIYIGYNPATNSVMPAGTQLAYLFIDPPNLGNN